MTVANCCQQLASEYQEFAELTSGKGGGEGEGGKKTPLMRQTAAQILRQFQVACDRYEVALKVGKRK